jgi:hypothetical protein
MSLTGRSNNDIIIAMYDHKKHIEALDKRIKKLEAAAKANADKAAA